MKKIVYIPIFILFFCQTIFSQNNVFEFKIHMVDSINYEADKVCQQYIPFYGDSTFIFNHIGSLLIELRNLGFYAASVDSLEFDSISVTAYLFVGKKYQISTIEIDGYGLIIKNIQQKIKYPLKLTDLTKIKENLIKNYENSGYPFAKILTDSLLFANNLLSLKLKVEKGSYITIDSLIIKGDARIKSYYINKYIGIKSGDEFSQLNINQIDSKIKNLSFLEQIKPAELEFRDNKVDLYLYLKNKRANQFNGIIGFLPSNDKSNSLIITGDLSLGLVNPFGRGEEVAFRWERLESSTQRLNVDFGYPYIFKSPFGLDLGFNLYKQDSTFLNLDWSIGIIWFASSKSKLRAYYRNQSSSVLSTIITTNNLADVSSSIIGISANYTSVDYIINPRKGIDFSVFGGAGNKEIKPLRLPTDTINSVKTKELTNLEAGLNIDYFFPVYKNIVFHFGNVTRYMGQFNDNGNQTTFFQNEMYRFGGARSLRGFDENAFSASIYSLQNVELRYLFEQNSAFYIFWNGAYYYQPLPEKTTEDFPWGIGVGLNFDTRAGIFSISYAVGKQFDNPIEIRTAKIHFGYISRF